MKHLLIGINGQYTADIRLITIVPVKLAQKCTQPLQMVLNQTIKNEHAASTVCAFSQRIVC